MKHRDPGAYGVRRFPFSDALPFLLDRQRKRFLAFARNDGTGKTVFSHRFLSHTGKALVRGCGSPSLLWKEVPRRGGGWLTQRNKKEWVRSIFSYRPPKRSRGRFFVARSLFPACIKHRDPGAYGVPCFPFSDDLPFLLDRQRKRFLAFARNDGTRKRYSCIASFSHGKGFGAGTRLSLLPMEGGAPKGRRLAHIAE